MKWLSNATRNKLLHWAFEIGIWFKGIDGLLELLGGFLFLAVNPHTLNKFIFDLTQQDLSEDPGTWLGNMLRHAGDHLSSTSHWIATAYLLGHGGIKLFFVIGILRGKLWCYPTAMIIISIFVLLQSVRMGFHFSFGMLTLTFIDAVIVLLIGFEFYRARRQQPANRLSTR